MADVRSSRGDTERTEDHPFDAFLDDVRQIVGRSLSEQQTTQAIAERMRSLLRDPTFLPPATQVPDPARYVMYPLHVDPAGRFSIASAVWGVGQRTPIHDHGTWGVIGIYRGVEIEDRFDPSGPVPALLETRILRTGDVEVCCTSDADVHRVACGSDEPCVGIHVYGDDIGTLPRRTYDATTGERSTFVSAWAEP